MADKTGVGGNVISTPKGGGAVSGMGEKFSPDLFSGTGNFSVPIALPPGRNGFQPDITLVYSSGNGNSPFGLGWNLSLPGVTRKASKGIPIYDDQKDVFILSGAEDLIPVDGAPAGAQRYRPRTEGLFARIDRYKDANNDYWKVWSKDGLISYYGTPNSANSQVDYNDPAVCADPSYKKKVFHWLLSKTEDVFGNHIHYSYTRDYNPDLNNRTDRQWDNLYLSEIKYADYENSGTKYLCSVKFIYEEREDAFSGYSSGFEMRTRKRCSKIEVYTHPEGNDVLTKTYHFVYLDQRVEAGEVRKELLPLNKVSLLSQVKIQGHDGEASEWMPPLEFSYTRYEPTRQDFFPIKGRELPNFGLSSGDFEMVDLFGCGLPDIVQLGSESSGGVPVARYWRNLGDGEFDIPREMKNAPAGFGLSDPEVAFMDADGDGKLDLVINKPGINGYFPLQHNGLWNRKSFHSYKYVPSFSLSDPEVKLLDLDGDGVTDVLRNGSTFQCFFNDPEVGFYKTKTIEKKKIKNFPNVSFADPRIRTGGMSGSSLQDIVMIHDGRVEYWPNMGHGNFAASISMKNSPRLPYNYDPNRILLSDVDGDGLSDMIYVENNSVTLWINQSGNSWSDPIVIKGTPPVYNTSAVRLADMLGTGVAGVLWTYDYDGLQRDRMLYLDFTGGIKPYLLNEMNNNMGAITRVAYKSSIHYYTADHKGIPPFTEDTRRRSKPTPWKTTLPFPVLVVGKTEVLDDISGGKLVTEYSYHHGYWDGGEREFRGFGKVIQRDTESFSRYKKEGLHRDTQFENEFSIASSGRFNEVSDVHYTPPMETRTWFHLGPVGDQFGDWKEVYFEDEYWDGDKQMLKRPGEMLNMIAKLPRRAKRDAYRTLRGSVLRTELYALDGTMIQDRPYTVSENLQGVRLEHTPSNPLVTLSQAAGPDANNKAGSGYIFFSHGLSSRTTQWERGTDPMTQFSFTEDYDTYGIPRKQVGVAVPRGRSPLEESGTAPYLATYAESDFVHKDEEGHYFIGRAISARSYEVVNDGNMSVYMLRDKILNNLPPTGGSGITYNLLSHSVTYYDGNAFEGLAHGVLGDYGVPVRTETLIMTDAQVTAIYGSNRPPYILASEIPGTPSWTSEYPSAFQGTVPANAGYLYKEGDSVYEEGYYVIADRKKFDFHDNPSTAKGLVLEMKDPLGHTASVEYDSYKMLPVKVTDPIGMETIASYDYRVMQASQITDPNLNRVQFAFSALGFLFKSAVMGKSTESLGDTLTDPGTLMEYDFFAWMNEKTPVFVKTTVREHHINDSVNNDTIVSLQYSDGFGRLLQTRTQCEEVIFGDSLFGDSNLPLDQTKSAQAIGSENSGSGDLNVIVSGWQVYNNKGQVVEKYEPFYDKGFDFSKPGEEVLSRRYDLKLEDAGEVTFSDSTQYHFGTNDFTIEGWVNYANTSYDTIISNVSGGRGFDLYFYQERLYLFLGDGASSAQARTVNTVSSNTWHHIAVLRIGNDPADIVMYIDGVEVATEPNYYVDSLVSGDINSGAVADITIGGYNGTDYYSGKISNVRLYNRQISSQEAADNCSLGRHKRPVNSSGLVLHAPLNEGAGTKVYDISSYKETGIFTGSGLSWEADKIARKVEMFYDPRGQVIRTKNPDNTEQRVIFGIPVALSNPNIFTPTPWESYTYDANDLRDFTHYGDTSVPNEHIHTPASSLIDPLGRTIKTIDRLTSSSNETEQVVMQYEFDIRGNLLKVKDAYERTTFEHQYDLANRPLKTTHIDGGDKYVFMNCMNMPLELRDAKGALVLNEYDTLNRPTKVWARDKSGETVGVRQRTIYGDDSVNAPADPEDYNLKGKPYKVYDEAGLTQIDAYDFKGNVPEKIRKVISDTEILTAFDGPPTDWEVQVYRVDWNTSTDSILDSFEYKTSMTYDALNRIKEMIYPEDVDSERKILIPSYNKAGALTKVDLKDTELGTAVNYVERIAYNAKGQRILVAFGNGVMTRYRYDDNNFRLLRMKTEKYTKTVLSYIPESGTIRQNLAYTYDLSGNIISINDQTTDCGIAGADELTREFSYDPLYRLLSATGREKDTLMPEPWYDTYQPDNPNLTRGYTQNYTYDKLGNILTLQHVASNSFTRIFNPDGSGNPVTDYGTTNLLNKIKIGSNEYEFDYDANGNITSDDGGGSRFYEYDYADRIKSFRVQAGTSEPSQYAHYLYDGGGNRVKKIVRKQGGGYKTTVYIDGVFEYHKASSYADEIPELEIGSWTIGSDNDGEYNILHIMDDQSRIATRRIGDDNGAISGDNTPAIKYNIDDHLGSSSMQLDTNGAIVSREEYYPFGETSFGSYAKKRYRFCGKEKDEESGLYYYGMRYYSAWTCRFMSVDPLRGKTPQLSPYCYANCNPIMMNDPTGGQSEVSANPETNDNLTDTGGDEYRKKVESSKAYKNFKPNEAKELAGHDKWEQFHSQGNLVNDKHQVELNNTLYSLAKKYGTTEENLKAWNPDVKGIDTGKLEKGTLLTVFDPFPEGIPEDQIQRHELPGNPITKNEPADPNFNPKALQEDATKKLLENLSNGTAVLSMTNDAVQSLGGFDEVNELLKKGKFEIRWNGGTETRTYSLLFEGNEAVPAEVITVEKGKHLANGKIASKLKAGGFVLTAIGGTISILRYINKDIDEWELGVDIFFTLVAFVPYIGGAISVNYTLVNMAKDELPAEKFKSRPPYISPTIGATGFY